MKITSDTIKNLLKKGKQFNNIILITALGLTLPVYAITSESDKLQKLEQQLELLTKEIEKIKKAAKVKAKGGGINVVSNDGNNAFEIGGRFQLDFNLFDGAYNAENNGHSGSDLFPRRVRTFVEGQADNWDYKLVLDFSEDQGEITLARLRYKGFNNGPVIKMGKIREDISLEALTSSKHITAISRPGLANVMSPYFKYGVSAYQYFKDTGLRYAIGMYKGGGFGTDGHDEDGAMTVSITSRFTWSPVHSGDKTIHLGVWLSERDFGGDTLSAAFARGEVRNTNVRLVNYEAGGDAFSVDDISQRGFEFAGVYGPFSLQAEFAERSINAVDNNNDDTFQGYYLTASYFLTGEHRIYAKRGVFNSPKPLLITGAWEVFARISNFDAMTKSQGTEVEVVTLGATYYLNKQIKVMANYIMSDVSGPGSKDLIGIHTEGNAFTARIQYLF